MSTFSLSVHRVKEIKFSAHSHQTTKWLVIEIDEDHEVTIFAASEEAFASICAQFNVEVPSDTN